MMSFLRQIMYEIKNILRAKFLLIMGILIIASSVAIPVIGYLTSRSNSGTDPDVEPPIIIYEGKAAYDVARGPMPTTRDDDSNSITIDGIVIYSNNPFFWNLRSSLDEKERLERDKNPFSSPAALDLMLDLIDEEIQYYLTFAQYITRYQDYRTELAWRGLDTLYDRFFYEHDTADPDVLIEVAGYKKGLDPETFREKFIDISAIERLAALDQVSEKLDRLYVIVQENDFEQYITMRIELERDQIAMLEENIAIQEQAIIENPSQEDEINRIIEDLRRQINIIETNTIPILEYRLEKQIIPGEDIWENRAIADIENSRQQLAYMVIMSEEEFNQSRSYDSGTGQTYEEYVAEMQRRIDDLNRTIIIAQKSLDAGEPDMKYVPEGARTRAMTFLSFSTVVALFGVLLGGWLIASEYQQGTIRLLMIRPKTRAKILLSKFAAAMLIWILIDVSGSLLNLLTNGIIHGFTDYTYPNYSVAGQTSFLVYYIPKFLACITPALFLFTLAFMLSVWVKNTAVSIAVPIVFYIGSVIVTSLMGFQNRMDWLAYTPLPYLQLPMFYRSSNIQYIIQSGSNLNIPLGIGMLLALSVIFIITSVIVFRKRDIVN